MKIAFTTLACPGWDMRQVVDCAVANGYDGVDFRGYKGKMPICGMPEFTTGLGETLKLFRDAKVEIPAVSSSARVFHKDSPAESIAEVQAYCDLAQRMGAPYVRVFGGGLGGTSWEQAIPRTVEVLRQMADIARPRGVTLAVETHDDWLVSTHLAEVMRRVERDNVGVLWDVHHPLQIAGEPLEVTARNLVPHTVYTHVKDSIRQADGKYNYCLPGEGQVPLDRIVALLAEGGYDGYLTVEWEKVWHPEIAEPEVALPAYAKALKSAIRKAGR